MCAGCAGANWAASGLCQACYRHGEVQCLRLTASTRCKCLMHGLLPNAEPRLTRVLQVLIALPALCITAALLSIGCSSQVCINVTASPECTCCHVSRPLSISLLQA